MSTAAMIYLSLTFIGLGVAAAKDGKPKDGKHSFFGTLITTAIVIGLLYWGGFFDMVR